MKRTYERQRDYLLFVFFFFLTAACSKLPNGAPFPVLPGTKALLSSTNQGQAPADPQMQFKTEADKERFYSWIVREMVEQVFLKDAKSTGNLDSWTNVLLQGGSTEGIYHGLVLSNEYENLERGTASVKAVRFYSEEMVLIRDQKLSQKDIDVRASKLVQENISAPLFTLKRLLGEQVLQEINVRKKDRKNFASWYAQIVLRWNAMGVPFGLPERNKMDLDFHRNWAETHPLELIQWELLNRVHRVLNQYGGLSLGGK